MKMPWNLRFLKRKFPHRLWGEAAECHLETQQLEENRIEVLLFLTIGIFKIINIFDYLGLAITHVLDDVITEGRIKD